MPPPVRWTTIGTGQVIIAPLASLNDFAHKIYYCDAGQELPWRNELTLVESSFMGKLEQYLGSVWCGIVGPGELLCHTPAIVFVELRLNEQVNYGCTMLLDLEASAFRKCKVRGKS